MKRTAAALALAGVGFAALAVPGAGAEATGHDSNFSVSGLGVDRCVAEQEKGCEQ